MPLFSTRLSLLVFPLSNHDLIQINPTCTTACLNQFIHATLLHHTWSPCLSFKQPWFDSNQLYMHHRMFKSIYTCYASLPSLRSLSFIQSTMDWFKSTLHTSPYDWIDSIQPRLYTYLRPATLLQRLLIDLNQYSPCLLLLCHLTRCMFDLIQSSRCSSARLVLLLNHSKYS